MDSTILAAFLGAIVALVAAVTSAILTIQGWREEQRRLLHQRKYESEVDHVRSQIEELYGPLYGLIQKTEATRKVYERVLCHLDEENNSSNARKEDYARIWVFFRERYFCPIGERQAKLINDKVHLLNSNDMPETFISFLRHQATEECLLQLWKEYDIGFMGRDVSDGYSEQSFKEDVKSSLDQLRGKYNSLILRQQNSRANQFEWRRVWLLKWLFS